MCQGLTTLGIEVEEFDDGAVIRGGQLGGGQVESFGDHRIAMAFAVAANTASADVEIMDTAAVATSFPGFAECMARIGARIEVVAGDAA